MINVRYSAFLGMLYVSNPQTEAAIATIKAEIGEDTVKQGFVGLTPRLRLRPRPQLARRPGHRPGEPRR
ncbi:MAG: hypothetical protein HC793_01145 [Aquincola sp.]|nr:hypothetical protein [Aquincola sp.]